MTLPNSSRPPKHIPVKNNHVNKPTLRYRTFSLPEIQQIYAPRQVHPNGDHFVINPLNQYEGSVILEIPSVLPVTISNTLIDPTSTLPDMDHILNCLLSTDPQDKIYALMGTISSGHGDTYRKLILTNNPAEWNTIYAIVHHQTSPCWANHTPVLSDDTHPFLFCEHVNLPTGNSTDFWLIPSIPTTRTLNPQFAEPIRAFCAQYRNLYNERLQRLSAAPRG